MEVGFSNKMESLLTQLTTAVANLDGNAVLTTLDLLLAGNIERSKEEEFLPVLFETVEKMATSSQIIQRATTALERILSHMSPKHVLQLEQLQLGLVHPVGSVRKLSFQQILRNGPQYEDQGKDYLSITIGAVADEDLSVYSVVEEILLQMAQTNLDSVLPLKDKPFAKSQEMNDSTVFMRVMSIFTKVASFSPEHAEAVGAAKVLNPLFELLSSEDDLLKLAGIELLKELTVTWEGYSLIREGPLLNNLMNILECEDELLAAVLLPNVLDFFANLSKTPNFSYSSFGNNQILVDCLSKCLASADLTQRACGLNAASEMASIPSGCDLLSASAKTGSCAVIQIFNHVLQRGQNSEIHIVAVHCLAKLMQNIQNTQKLQQLYEKGRGSANVIPAVMQLAQIPFSDLREASLSLILSISKHEWGKDALVFSPGFMEWIVNRDHLSTEESHLKFKIIESLLEDASKLSSSQVISLRGYVRDGIMYKSRQAQIAVEDDNLS
eukprot:m.6899 g.6899  ORF g.6899 m.6899 type:complete len:497 (+) comp3601_c0_seq2:179-1669(+)